MPKFKAKGITVKKSDDFSEWFTQVTQKAELADIRYGVQGFIAHMPWAVKISRKIYEYFEQEIEADGHEPMLLPTVIPEENLNKEAEHAGFIPDVFWVTHAGKSKLENKLGLRPTGETQIYPMYSLWIRSHADLPYKRYQSRITTFRHEMTTRPFMRGREFMFFEAHDVFATHNDAMKQIKTDVKIMERVVSKKLLIPFIFFKRPQWDKFMGADYTFASDTLNPDGRRNQISSTHDLGTNFAKPFNVTFTDKNGKDQYGHQTCFGPGIWRIIAALISIHGDDQGLLLPFDLAPTQVVITPIIFAGKEKEATKVNKHCKALQTTLQEASYRVHFDNRDMTPGEKFNIWEMKGVPLRIEVGPREAEANKATIVRRTDRNKTTVSLSTITKAIQTEAEKSDKTIKQNASAYFKNKTKDASTFQDVDKTLKKHPGFVKAPWCSIDKDGEDCANKLKEKTSAYVCGVELKEEIPKKGSTCIICKKTAKHIVHIAKSI
jgi:prolyl-tRNA synthetase